MYMDDGARLDDKAQNFWDLTSSLGVVPSLITECSTRIHAHEESMINYCFPMRSYIWDIQQLEVCAYV